jgi:hypothetical protein
MFGFFKTHKDAWWMAGVDVEWETFAASRYVLARDRTVTEILHRILARYGTAFPQRLAAGVVSLCFGRAMNLESGPGAYLALAVQPNGQELLSRAFREWFHGRDGEDFLDTVLRDCAAELQAAAA